MSRFVNKRDIVTVEYIPNAKNESLSHDGPIYKLIDSNGDITYVLPANFIKYYTAIDKVV